LGCGILGAMQKRSFNDLFQNLKVVKEPADKFAVQGLTVDSRSVREGWVFFAVEGADRDGHDFLPKAIQNGASAVVVQRECPELANYDGAIVKATDMRAAIPLLAAQFYAQPSEELFSVGITGTDGKTTVAYLTDYILRACGMNPAVLGTIDHHLGEKVWQTQLTTPGPIDLQARLREVRQLGADAVVMEVSSHALDQERATAVSFDVGIFTNFTRDHLDYHKTIEAYFSAKELLFTKLLKESSKSQKYAVLNEDDKAVSRLTLPKGVKKIGFGATGGEFRYGIKSLSFSGCRFELQYQGRSFDGEIPLVGDFNVANVVCALAAASVRLDKPDIEGLLLDLRSCSGVPGRLQKVENEKGIHAFVDFAHTDQALKKVLTVLTSIRKHDNGAGRIITVFGCGGDRDKGKRPLMAKVVEAFSDNIIVTSDNPRNEDPQSIINEIAAGLCRSKPVEKIVDRREAISKAVQLSQPGDVVLVAGKGHEPYQIIGDKKIDFNDVEVIKECLHES
jgi:UDP-N-acetylmuramoyl-L-alanyl-D-glutamate--2,6-diaminopimelate ligase